MNETTAKYVANYDCGSGHTSLVEGISGGDFDALAAKIRELAEGEQEPRRVHVSERVDLGDGGYTWRRYESCQIDGVWSPWD